MKTVILIWLIAAATAVSEIIADGTGFFPVMVQVVDADSGTPIKGAKVRLEGAGIYTDQGLDPKRQTKVLPDRLGKPLATNAEGVAVVFSHGGWSSTTVAGKSTYFRSMAGTIIVEFDGKEIFRSTLKDWAKKNGFRADPSSAPWIIVSPPTAK